MTMKPVSKRCRGWTVLTLGCLLCCGPQRAMAAGPESVHTTFFDLAVAFRTVAATNPAAAARCFQATQPLAFALQHEAAKALPQLWPQFFSSAFVVAGRVRSAKPIFAFYNPLFDGVLLTQWGTDSKGVGIITAASFAKGSDLAGKAPITDKTAMASWIDSGRTPPLALGQALHKFITDFETQHPPEAKEAALLSTTPAGAAHLIEMARHTDFNQKVLALLHNAKYRDIGDKIWPVLAAFSAGDRTRLTAAIPSSNPLPVNKILEIPEVVRKSMTATYAVVTDSTCLVFLLAPNTPQFLGILALGCDKQGWRVRAFEYYDLAVLK